MSEDHFAGPPVEPIMAGLRGRCPRCGQGRLFSGFLTVAPRCEVCGLDYSFADPADGPAIFVMLIIGFVVVGLALWVEVTYEPAALAAFPRLDPAGADPLPAAAQADQGLTDHACNMPTRPPRVAGTGRSEHLCRVTAPPAAGLAGACRRPCSVRLPVGLGTWQVERLHWKEGLLAKIDAAHPCSTAAACGGGAAPGRRRRHRIPAGRRCRHFLNGEERHFFATWQGAAGYYVFTPLELGRRPHRLRQPRLRSL